MTNRDILMKQKTGVATYDELRPVTRIELVELETNLEHIVKNNLVFAATSCTLASTTYTILVPQLLGLSTQPTEFLLLVPFANASPATADIEIIGEGGGGVLMTYSLYTNTATQIAAGDIQPGTAALLISDTANKAFVLTDFSLILRKSLFANKGEILAASASATPAVVTKPSANGQKLVGDSAQTSGLGFIDDDFAIEVMLGDGTNAIPTGVLAGLEIPVDCTIEGWTITEVKGATGSIVVDVWKDTYANYPPTVADTIAGSEKPTLSSAVKNQDLSLTTWTTTLTKGDWLLFNVDSAATVTLVCVSLRCKKTAVA